jgi:site-specific DNA-methyltransferase (adenine-specific)
METADRSDEEEKKENAVRKEIIGDCVLYRGDCLEIMPLLEKKSVDMVLCDLPYGTTACRWDSVIPFDKLWAQYDRICKGVMALTSSQPFTSALVLSHPRLFKYELIWDKKHGKAPGVAKFRPMPSHESILIFGRAKSIYNPQWGKGTPYVDKRKSVKIRNKEDGHKFGYNGVFESVSDGKRYPLSVIEIKTSSKKGSFHPTQKPVELMEYLIRTYSHTRDIILDNAMGSGTTGVAAVRERRKFVGIEKEQKYFDIACKRIEEAVNASDSWMDGK